jgi:hypothetical protein
VCVNKLTLLLGASHLLNECEGRVEVEGTEEVSKVHGVNACAFTVIDAEGKLRPYNNNKNLIRYYVFSHSLLI